MSMTMGDDDSKVIEIEASSSSPRTPSSSGSKRNNLVHSPKFLSMLITLCLATFTITMLEDTNMIFACLAFLLLVCCNCIFSRMIVAALFFFTERHFVIKASKSLYFLFAVRTSVLYLFTSSSVLLPWCLLINSHTDIFLVYCVTSTLATFVIAIGMWIVKIVILKVLDFRFHHKNFINNMQDLVTQEYVLQTLLGPPRAPSGSDNNTMMARLMELFQGALAYMWFLLSTRFHTICDALANDNFEDEHRVENDTSMLLKNLTNSEPRDIQETDLLRVMGKEDIAKVLQLFEGGAETKSISKASLQSWMVRVRKERQHLVDELNKTSNVIKELNKIVSRSLLFMVALVWCIVMGFQTAALFLAATSHVLVYISAEYCKMIWGGIMFAISIHPFDEGDHCIMDNEQLVVKMMGLSNTEFLKTNKALMICPNSALLTKSISNLNRSSELRETLQLSLSSPTSSDTIAALKLKINELLDSKPESWRAEHCFEIRGVEDMQQKYNLEVTYAAQFKNYEVKERQRSELVEDVEELLNELNINSYTIQ